MNWDKCKAISDPWYESRRNELIEMASNRANKLAPERKTNAQIYHQWKQDWDLAYLSAMSSLAVLHGLTEQS